MARHNWDISLLDAMQPDYLVPFYLLFVLPPIALVFLKASFFILYLQFFGVLRWVRLCCYAGVGLIAIIHTTIGIYSFVIASPWRSDWAHRAEGIAMAASILGFFVDITILVIPVIAIERLQLLSVKRKVAAVLIFTAGGLACFCSAFNIYARRSLFTEPDQTWRGVVVTISTVCELFIGIICACAPSAVHGFRNSSSIWRKLFPSHSLTISDSAELKIGHQRYDHSDKNKSSLLPDELRSTDKKYARYFELDDKVPISDVQEVPLAHMPPGKNAKL